MCVVFCIIASMLAWEGTGYASSSVILSSNLMFTTMRPLHVVSALVVYTIKHEYVNGVNSPHSIRPCLGSLSNFVSIILRFFGLSRYTLALPAMSFSF